MDKVMTFATDYSTYSNQTPIHVLFADDDIDDQFFFDEELSSLPIPTELTTVEDGEALMQYLHENSSKLPDILFLDMLMPKKNGSECLKEIKSDKNLKRLPVIIYSSLIDNAMFDWLYNNGAHYYVQKPPATELQQLLHYVLKLLVENRFSQPARDNFILTMEGQNNLTANAG